MKLTMMTNDEKKLAFPVLLYNREGNVSKTCYDLGLSRQTYNNWVNDDPEFAIACSEVGESLLDMTEDMLIRNIKAGKSADIKLMLTTRGRNRGYGEKMEVEHTGLIRHAHGVMHYPPEPVTVEEWEEQIAQAEQGRLDRGESAEREKCAPGGDMGLTGAENEDNVDDRVERKCTDPALADTIDAEFEVVALPVK